MRKGRATWGNWMEQQNYKYTTVANEIRGQIEAGRLTPGARLLPAKELGARMGCHHHTVRQALKKLMREGYIESISGSGTFVAKV